ncbi:MAG TPA: glycoside hydrolase family 3 N-terminal domain-containing protein, partial [Vicinamibacteria bacterium]
ATLSPLIVGGMLRKDMKYDGVIVSDDLEMGAITRHWPAGKAAVLAAQAGCDLLPVCKTADAQVASIEAVIRAVEAEEISTKAMDDAEARIRALKERFTLPYRDPDPREARRVAGLGEHRSLAEEIGSRSGLPARA